MDDLKLLRELRADTPEPDADRLRELRKRALRRRRRLPVMPSVLVVAVAAAAVVVATAERPQVTRVVPETVLLNAETVLEQAARAAAKRAAPSRPRPDQWQYTRTLVVQPSSGERTEQERWIRYDGKQTASREPDGTVRVVDLAPDPGDDDLPPQGYARKLAELPTDPDELLRHVTGDRHWIDLPKGEGSAEGGEDPASRAYRVLGVYLGQQAVMPPKLEAAIFRALAKIPGVTIEQGVTDAAGRVGLGMYRPELGYDPNVSRRYRIFDPTTYRVLADQTIYLQDYLIEGEVAFRQGSVSSFTTLGSGIVDKPGDVP
ncbi:MAG: CU044_5270 family protein [Thermoactinospora sp.]|nr:CU044_5270 family protein [Thermoactinospora sp.]